MPIVEVPKKDVNRSGFSIGDAKVFRQEYNSEPLPNGVAVVAQRVFRDEYGGHFMENARFDLGRVVALMDKEVGFDIANGQSNTSVIVPGTERFGHLHRDQNEFWMVVDGTLSVGLLDLRDYEFSEGVKSKVVLSAGTGLYIPRGVVHGLANYTKEKAVLVYFTDHKFSPDKDTQEWRFVSDDPKFWDFTKPDKI